MLQHLIVRLYEAVTRRPYYTVRRASVEFGPPPAAVHAAQLAKYSDAELYARGPEILAQLRRDRARARAGAGR
jgi:hypothetical protein